MLVTGAPRSGTRHITQVLNSAGVPADHESNFPGGFESGIARIGPSDGMVEVSWAGVPWIPYVDFPSVQVVRHPLKVIASMTTLGRWREIHEPFLQRHVPHLYSYTDEIESLAAFWLEWNRRAESATFRWNLHELTTDHIMEVLKAANIKVIRSNVEASLEATPTDVGHHEGVYRPNLSWEDLGRLRSEVFDMAQRYGLE